MQFKVCAVFQLAIDFGKFNVEESTCIYGLTSNALAIIAQRLYYGTAIPATVLEEVDDLEQALALAE